MAPLHAQKHNKGMIAHYLFNGELSDNSGNENTGNPNGGIKFDVDRFGNICGALKFNGSDGFVSVPSSRSLKSPKRKFSVAVWFRLDAEAGDIKWLTVCCKSNSSMELPNSPQYRFQATNQTISFNTEFTENIVKDVAIDTWHHYAMVYNGRQITAYLDGKPFFEFPYQTTIMSNDMPLEIGRDVPGNLEYFAGSLDDLRIYNRALSPKEITAIYRDNSEKNSYKPCTAPPIPTPSPNTDPVPVVPVPDPVVITPVPPQITIIDPINAPRQTNQAKEEISAKIRHIDSKSDITFKVNGEISTAFSFYPNEQLFKSNVLLDPGVNVFEIFAQNKDGKDQESVVFKYNKKPEPPAPIAQAPRITINHPISTPYTAEENKQYIEASIENVKDGKDIEFKLNGKTITDFKFNPTNGILEYMAPINDGFNVFEITAKNKTGKDAATGIINFQSDVQPPKVRIEVPHENPFMSKQAQLPLRAKVDHVDNKEHITFSLNMATTRAFQFDATTGILDAELILENGYNLVEIIAKNKDGEDKAFQQILYHPINKAEVTIDSVKVKEEIKLSTHKIELLCYDHHKIDGDIVSVIINDKVVFDKIELTSKSKREMVYTLEMLPGETYTIVSKAWNEGRIPPNTMTLELLEEGRLLKKIKLESKIGISEAIRLTYQPK